MKPNIRAILDMANKLRQSLGGAGGAKPRGLDPKQYQANIDRLSDATDWGKGRDAIRRASNQFNGSSDEQIENLLAAMRAAMDRMRKSGAPDGPNWKSSQAGMEDMLSTAEAKAIAARQGAKESIDADALATNLLAKIKETLPKTKNADDLEGLAEAFSNLGDTPVFDQLVKEGLIQAFSEKSVSNLLKSFTTSKTVSELDNITSRFASSKLRNLLNSDTAQIQAIRAAAAEARVRLLRKAYANVGRLAANDPNAARTQMAAIDSYIQRRMAGQYPMFNDAQRNVLAAARTSAFGKVSTAPMTAAPPPPASPARTTRRNVGPAPDADPLAGPLAEEPPPTWGRWVEE